MSDLIRRQAAIDALMPIYKSASLRNRNVFSTARKCMVTIEELQSARPDNQINLCDSCDYSYPDCPSKNGDVIFGNNIGNDNICACNKYKPSAQLEQRWIPCSERLPEEDTEVLISYRYKEGEGDTDHVNIDITSYGTTCFGGREIHTLKEWRQPFDYFHANYEVIAWMPLPEPYKEGENND